MNRVEIKEQAKKMIIDNKWYIWKPMLIVSLIVGLISVILSTIIAAFGMNEIATSIITIIVSLPVGIFSSAFMIGYCKYCLDFIHGKKTDWTEPVKFAKEHWVICFLVSFLYGLIIIAGSILLVIPGIIAALGLMFYYYVCAENPKLKATEILKKTWNITNGHKFELFVLILSFFGWTILAALTLGILYIWLFPYMIITFTLAYDKLKK